jgi:hypothetical protein
MSDDVQASATAQAPPGRATACREHTCGGRRPLPPAPTIDTNHALFCHSTRPTPLQATGAGNMHMVARDAADQLAGYREVICGRLGGSPGDLQFRCWPALR